MFVCKEMNHQINPVTVPRLKSSLGIVCEPLFEVLLDIMPICTRIRAWKPSTLLCVHGDLYIKIREHTQRVPRTHFIHINGRSISSKHIDTLKPLRSKLLLPRPQKRPEFGGYNVFGHSRMVHRARFPFPYKAHVPSPAPINFNRGCPRLKLAVVFETEIFCFLYIWLSDLKREHERHFYFSRRKRELSQIIAVLMMLTCRSVLSQKVIISVSKDPIVSPFSLWIETSSV